MHSKVDLSHIFTLFRFDFNVFLQIDMAAEQEHFYQVTSTALTILAQDLEAACDAALLAMTKIKYVFPLSI